MRKTIKEMEHEVAHWKALAEKYMRDSYKEEIIQENIALKTKLKSMNGKYAVLSRQHKDLQKNKVGELVNAGFKRFYTCAATTYNAERFNVSVTKRKGMSKEILIQI
jgi:hypothetical protein